MLDSQVSRKIVVAVGLAIVFGAISFYAFTEHAGPASTVARSVPPPAAPPPAAPPPAAPTGSDPSVAAQTAVTPAQPTADTPASSSLATTAPAAAPPPADESSSTPTKPKPKASSHHTARRLAAADGATNSTDSAKDGSDGPPAPAATETASTPGTPADLQQQPATTAAANQEPVASDSQITAGVKSQIASAAPESSVDVTTTNGVVALAGSVPSPDVAERVKQAALRVAGVKDVDASALKLSDQLR